MFEATRQIEPPPPKKDEWVEITPEDTIAEWKKETKGRPYLAFDMEVSGGTARAKPAEFLYKFIAIEEKTPLDDSKVKIEEQTRDGKRKRDIRISIFDIESVVEFCTKRQALAWRNEMENPSEDEEI